MNKTIFPWAEQSLTGAEHLATFPAASCLVYQTFLENSQGEGFQGRSLAPHPPALLQLRARHLLLFDPQSQLVLACCPCEPGLKVYVRTSEKGLEEGKERTEGRSVVLVSHANTPQLRLAFVVAGEERKSLEYFGIALEKCAIIQIDFHQKFKPLRKLGKGATAAVYSAVRTRDGQIVAVKAFNKSTQFAVGNGKGQRALEQQLRVLAQSEHQSLCGFEGAFETENSIYLVMPNYDRTLMALLQTKGDLSRSLIISLMRQLLSALAYLHSQGLMHRDLKMENIMLIEGRRAVIIDMGMVQQFAAQTYLFEQCGTPGYVAPQLFGPRSPHPQRCDVFSLGVIFHVLLFKRPVFSGENKFEIYRNNRDSALGIDIRLSKEAPSVRDLLMRMLEEDNHTRISAAQALEHELFTKEDIASSAESEPPTPLLRPLHPPL